jgi:hypothetical protein
MKLGQPNNITHTHQVHEINQINEINEINEIYEIYEMKVQSNFEATHTAYLHLLGGTRM